VPVKVEVVVPVPMSHLQRQTYRMIVEQNFELLAGAKTARGPLNNTMMRLRQCANHPFLTMAEPPAFASEEEWRQRMVGGSGKMAVLHFMLKHLQAAGHRCDVGHGARRHRVPRSLMATMAPCVARVGPPSVLIFSQFVTMLDLIARYLRATGIAFERLDGNSSKQDRQAAIDRFTSTRRPLGAGRAAEGGRR